MTAPTVHLRRVYAHTTTRNGRMHLCSQRDSGALVPLCGADRLRGKRIAIHDAAPDGVALCLDCRNLDTPVVRPAAARARHRAPTPAVEPATELLELATLIGRFFNIRTRISRRKILLDLTDTDLNRLLTALRSGTTA